MWNPWIYLVTILFSLASPSSPPPGEIFSIPGGPKFNLISNPAKEGSRIRVLVDAGQLSDGDEGGIAQLTARVLLTASKHNSIRYQFYNRLRQLGAQIKCTTSLDHTSFALDISDMYVTEAFSTLISHLLYPLFREEDVGLEMKVLENEYYGTSLKGIKSTEFYFHSQLLTRNAPKHPLSKLHLGNVSFTENSINDIKKKIENFHSTYYQVDNMIIVFESSLTIQQLKSICAETISSYINTPSLSLPFGIINYPPPPMTELWGMESINQITKIYCPSFYDRISTTWYIPITLPQNDFDLLFGREVVIKNNLHQTRNVRAEVSLLVPNVLKFTVNLTQSVGKASASSFQLIKKFINELERELGGDRKQLGSEFNIDLIEAKEQVPDELVRRAFFILKRSDESEDINLNIEDPKISDILQYSIRFLQLDKACTVWYTGSIEQSQEIIHVDPKTGLFATSVASLDLYKQSPSSSLPSNSSTPDFKYQAILGIVFIAPILTLAYFQYISIALKIFFMDKINFGVKVSFKYMSDGQLLMKMKWNEVGREQSVIEKLKYFFNEITEHDFSNLFSDFNHVKRELLRWRYEFIHTSTPLCIFQSIIDKISGVQVARNTFILDPAGRPKLSQKTYQLLLNLRKDKNFLVTFLSSNYRLSDRKPILYYFENSQTAEDLIENPLLKSVEKPIFYIPGCISGKETAVLLLIQMKEEIKSAVFYHLFNDDFFNYYRVEQKAGCSGGVLYSQEKNYIAFHLQGNMSPPQMYEIINKYIEGLPQKLDETQFENMKLTVSLKDSSLESLSYGEWIIEYSRAFDEGRFNRFIIELWSSGMAAERRQYIFNLMDQKVPVFTHFESLQSFLLEEDKLNFSHHRSLNIIEDYLKI